jgi:hypothetical protein
MGMVAGWFGYVDAELERCDLLTVLIVCFGVAMII